MLKIKDNFDIKKLKRFGFQPLYDEHTGELKEMYYTFSYSDKKKLVVKKEKKKNKEFKFYWRKGFTDKYGYYLHAFVDCGYVNEYADVLYSLIKADIVEKVDE